MKALVIVVVSILMSVWSTVFFNRWLPRWFCDKMGWHLPPEWRGFDGCSFTGVCPRCGEKVLQDSQGNWF